MSGDDASDERLRLGVLTRLLAALSYLGAMALIIVISGPGRRFATLHSRVALPLHILRMLWVSAVLLVWWRQETGDATAYDDLQFAGDAALLLVAGVPRASTLQSDALVWIIWPLVITWILSLIGLVLALAGRTADLRAFASADWNDLAPFDWYSRYSPGRDREIARRARQRHLEKLQRSTKVMGFERTRRERLTEIEEEIVRLQAEHDHLNQLLALGEISHRRYDSLMADIKGELMELQQEFGTLTLRNTPPQRVPQQLRVTRQDRAPESEVETIAIVTPAGVPLFSYGSFLLDEALVAGILSVMDSISEEMFGSRVHKTELAEGRVLHFAHGQYVVILAIFTDEPSPRQIEQLRTMLQRFEAANGGPLSRNQHDPSYLHEVHPPFEFSKVTPQTGTNV